jgi:hypothetical protein
VFTEKVDDCGSKIKYIDLAIVVLYHNTVVIQFESDQLFLHALLVARKHL